MHSLMLFQHHFLFFYECPTALRLLQEFFKYVRVKEENKKMMLNKHFNL